MPRHPTVQVPNIGPMDHAWDLLGEWQAEFELPETESPVHGKVTFRSWTDAELMLDPVEAAIAGIPAQVPLERASEIHLTDAGGGALQWVLHAPSTNWSLQATMWPGLAPSVRERRRRRRRTALPGAGGPDAGVLPAEVPARLRSESPGPSSCKLHGFGAPPAPARAEIAELSQAERLKRAAVVFGAFVAVAMSPCPIPIVHFVLVPGGLLLAVTLGCVRLREGEIFRAVEGRCPFCGTEQQFPVLGRFRLPREVHCASCHRRLTLDAGGRAIPSEARIGDAARRSNA